MKNEKSAIIIVNWNGKKFLKNCLNAVYKQTYKNFQVYFVDNGSIDGSFDYVRENFPKAKIIQLDKNYGFAKGNNEGIKEAFKDKKVKYIICLNNDTIVDKNWLRELIKTAEKDKNIGAVSSKAYFKDGKTIQNAGLYYKQSPPNKIGGVSIGYGLTDKEAPELSKEINIFAPGGVAPLYKRKMLEEIYKRDKEFFDEDFFAYTEDYDLGYRIRKLGYTSILSPKAKLIHLHSQTGGIASPFKAYYSYRNSILTTIKNMPFIEMIKFNFRRMYILIYGLFKKNKSIQKLKGNVGFLEMFWILIKAHFSALLLMPKMLIKRWKIQSNKKVSNKEINEWFKKFNRKVIEK